MTDKHHPKIHCPALPAGATLPFDYAEIEPLLQYLIQNEPIDQALTFNRGTVTTRQTLDCCKQDLGPAGADLLTRALKHNNQIKAILFGTGSIGNDGAKSVGDLLRENDSIETVYLGCNLIDAEGTQHLVEALKDNTAVHALWLKRNPLGTEGAKALTKLLHVNRNIRTLDLVNTLIGEEGLEVLVDTLVDLDYPLEVLFLGGNFLGPKAAPSLRKLLKHCATLKQLYLSVNHLGDEGLLPLYPAILIREDLEVLSLASNGLTQKSTNVLFDSMDEFHELHSLDLGYAPSTKVLGAQPNRIGDIGVVALKKYLQRVQHLVYLDVCENQFSNWGLQQILQGMIDHPSLVQLQFTKVKDQTINQQLKAQLALHRSQNPPIPRHEDLLTIRSVYR